MKAVGEEDQKQCRVCFGEEGLFDKFIYPCSCDGSIKYIHESCLKTYLITKNPQQEKTLTKRSTSTQKCDVCKKDFKVYWSRKYKAKTCLELWQNEKIPIFFLLLDLGLLIATLYVFIRVRSEVYDQVVEAMVTVLCVISFVFIFACSFYTILKCFFKRIVSISKITTLTIKQPQIPKSEVVPLQA